MPASATTVKQYLAGLPKDRRDALEAVRAVILKNLPKGYEEGIQYGMIGYFVPHSVFPAGYHCDPAQPVPFAGLASQKNYMSLYLMCIYGDPEHEAWFREAWAKTGKKLDMGKSCIRFKKADDLPLAVIGQAIRRVPVKKFLAGYEAATGGRRKTASRPTPAKRAKSAKKTVSRKTATRKTRGRTAKSRSRAASRS